MSLRRKALEGLRWTAISSVCRSALQLLQIAILARLLVPSDFGLVAIVVAVLAFLQIFSDMGFSNAIVHYRQITNSQLSSLYWLSVIASSSLALLVALLSGWVAEIYKDPALESLLSLAGLGLVLNSLGNQLRVVAQKELRFGSLAAVEVSAALAGLLGAVTVALMGGGAISLVIASLCSAGTATCLSWLWLSNGWRPFERINTRAIRPFFRFGFYMIGNNLVNAVNSQADILLGSRAIGSQGIGVYSVYKELNLRISGVFNAIATQVGMPVMASGQEDRALLERIYLQTVRMTTSVNFPVYAALFVFADDVVAVLLGEQWRPASGVLKVMACWALLRSIGSPVGSLLVALGKVDISFRWNACWLPITVLTVWFGSQYGELGLAWAMTALVVANFLPNWYFLVRPLCGATLKNYCKQVFIPFALAVIAASAAIALALPFSSPPVRLCVGAIISGSVYLLLCYRFNRVWIEAMLEVLFQWRAK